VISIINTTVNSAKQAVETAINYSYMENNDSFKLQDLIKLQGKGWKYNARYRDGDYYFPNKTGTSSYAYIVLDKSKKIVIFRINCNNFDNDTEKDICKEYIQSDMNIANVYNEQHLTY